MTGERGDGARAEPGDNVQLANYRIGTAARATISKPQLRALNVLGSEFQTPERAGGEGLK